MIATDLATLQTDATTVIALTIRGTTAKLGATYTPMSYCTGHGLWEGKPFVLCDADDTSCDASGILALPGPPLDTRARRKAEEVGRDVLARRAKLKS